LPQLLAKKQMHPRLQAQRSQQRCVAWHPNSKVGNLVGQVEITFNLFQETAQSMRAWLILQPKQEIRRPSQRSAIWDRANLDPQIQGSSGSRCL